MALTPRQWENSPSTDTPLSAANLIDTEERLGAYADSVGAGGIELGYASITANVTSTSTTPADVIGLAITIVVGVRPIVLEFGSVGIASSTAGCIPVIKMLEGSTTLRAPSYPQAVSTPTTIRKRLAPSAGSHSYKIQFGLVAAVGTGTLVASATDGNEAYLVAYEV